MPGPLSDDLLGIIHRHSLPLAVDDRDVLAEVIDALEEFRELGPGLVSRVCREHQAPYRAGATGLDGRKPAGPLSIPKRKGRTPGTQFLERRGYRGGWR